MTPLAQPLPTVVVPVFNGAQVLPACLEALSRTLPQHARVLLVDDASTDSAIGPMLDDFAKSADFTVENRRNPRNLGFVATVNAGMAANEGDIVLLNSDTVVTPGWIEALARCAASDSAIATATPWSNNAEICSWPELCRAAAVPTDPARIAAAAASASNGAYPELPTGVGFCMLVRRTALDALGDFDAETFGRGYGEENDFCCRAAGHGWRNVLCADAYVAHVGHASFAAEEIAPGGDNQRRLEARYPCYARIVQEFIAADPLAPLRAAIAAHLAATSTTRPSLTSVGATA